MPPKGYKFTASSKTNIGTIDRRTKAEILAEVEALKRAGRSSAEAATLRESQVMTSLRTMEKELSIVRARAKARMESNTRYRRQISELQKELASKAKEPTYSDPYARQIAELVALLPLTLQEVVTEIAMDNSMNDTVKLVLERERDFSSPEKALLAGIAMGGKARVYIDNEMDKLFGAKGFPDRLAKTELVVGAGIHAAIYCAVRVAMGFPKPIVIDGSPRAGGVFAQARSAVFRLNSRNRPGELSIPGLGALNVLPGAALQPSEISGDEYQANDTLGFIARMTLAMNATVIPFQVQAMESIRRTGMSLVRVGLSDGGYCEPGRVIVATGVGSEKTLTTNKSERIVSFSEFMRRMDSPFPMRGMKRVAVIGAGDSGKTAIESLTGQGPSVMSSVALDSPERIDWFGVLLDRYTRESWEACSRSRYKPISRLLPSDDGGDSRVNPIVAKALRVAVGYNCVYVNEVPYDYVVNCTGFFEGIGISTSFDLFEWRQGGMTVGKRGINDAGINLPVYVVGPAAALPTTNEEEVILRGISENKTSLFRYAPRTAALAASLEAV